MYRRPRLHKREIERITIVRRYDARTDLFEVREEAVQEAALVWFVEDGELAFVLVPGRVFEIVNVLRDDFAVRDEESLRRANQND